MGEGVADLDFAERVELHRHELQVHCYRMLGSFTDAEDMVQETLLRAWRHRDDLREGDNVRAWLYKIATNACLDHIKAHRRRVPSLASFRDIPWLEPYPDRLLAQSAPAREEPPARAIERETIALTFLAVIQLLPARQRAAHHPPRRPRVAGPRHRRPARPQPRRRSTAPLQGGWATWRSQIPRSERETWAAEASSRAERGGARRLHRGVPEGRRRRHPGPGAQRHPRHHAARAVLVRRARRHPPARRSGPGHRHLRLLPTWANRQPAAACYLLDPASGEFRAFKLDVLGLAEGKIAEITTFGHRHFPAFDLVAVLP